LREKILRWPMPVRTRRHRSAAGDAVGRARAPAERRDRSRRLPSTHGYVLAEETFDPPTTPLDADGQGEPYAVYGFGAQIAEVEVDSSWARCGCCKITAAHDVGRAINPQLVEGQIEGGVAQGIGSR
jgi:aldehyde oxidoreductase